MINSIHTVYANKGTTVAFNRNFNFELKKKEIPFVDSSIESLMDN